MELNDLLVKGYFPEELTPPFTSEDLKLVSIEVQASLSSFNLATGHKKTSRPASFSVPKIKGYRRNLGIPVPLHYVRLATVIVDHWQAIEDHCAQSTISLSRLRVKEGALRSVLKPNFKNITKEKIIRSTGNRFMLKIDIAKFYSLIYTHSIPWALHTKPFSKVNRQRKFFGNALDEDSRNIQDGQTIGIPIGPDTSRIISEIILCSIDKAICDQVGTISGVRVVDDYHLYFKSLGELEKGRVAIHKALKEYELELNQSKERVEELPEIIENEWFRVIREYKFRNRWTFQRTDLIAYFDTVIAFSRKFPDDMVFTFAMSKLRFTVFNKKNWKILQSLLLNSLLLEPKIIPYVAQNLISYDKKKYPIDNSIIKEALEQFIIHHCDLTNDFEIVWALWLAKELKITLSERVGQALSKNSNSIVILTALDLRDKEFLPENLDISLWESLLVEENLFNEHWLVAYEAKKKGWLTSIDNYIDRSSFYKLLSDADVSFYKEDKMLDLDKVKVTTNTEYLGDEDEEDQDKESDSVFSAANNNAKKSFFESITASKEPLDDLPF